MNILNTHSLHINVALNPNPVETAFGTLPDTLQLSILLGFSYF